ncbi:MAG TPA: DUF262 domain-containing protein [Candidatus Binatia bacterium]|nr:DUF262 domain-containing protein [Candidatus Binatia bacterium]
MKVNKLTVGAIFDQTQRLEAPLFQRPYVWKENENWVPLWESLRSVLEKRVGGQEPRPHFLGAIVLDQLGTPTGKVHVRQIIDGQQRLTTLQIALAAIRDFCRASKQEKYADAFKRFTTNDAPLSKDPDELFKVWPTNADREEFRKVMTVGQKEQVESLLASQHEECLIAEGYLFFVSVFGDWLHASNSGSFDSRLDAMYTALRDDLHLVVIDLEKEDDAQEIFETLNALGTPLFTADLVKNYFFRLAESKHEDTHKLYRQFWATYDTEKGYWREEVRQGRLKRPRIDTFLQHYLTLRTAEEINTTQLFSAFRDFVAARDGETVTKQMAQFRSYSDVYQKFDNFLPGCREGLFFYRLDQLDTTTVYPLLLEAFKRFDGPEYRDELEQIIVDLESYFVRRAVCDLTAKNYNKLFVQAIRRLEANNDFSASAIRRFLLDQSEDTARWPSDDEFSRSWLTLNFYKRLKRSKCRMILEALEAGLHTKKTETMQVPDGLTIEHLMPREWEKNWPLIMNDPSPEVQAGAKDAREIAINSIGNLTLLTKSLNPSVSNGPWAKKRQEILKHSALNLNRELPDAWDEARIGQRSKDLLKIALKIWPRPEEDSTQEQ